MPPTAISHSDERHDKTTVPLDFVEGFDLDGKRCEWSVTSGNTFGRRVIDDGNNCDDC
jgi:hypothetical protein